MAARFAYAVTCALLMCAAAQAEDMVRNGGFEAAHVVKAAASVDIGFGVWALGEGKLAPDKWTLNTAYPGEFSVLSAGAHSGKSFVRIRGANEQRPAHVYQPVPGLQPGTWYRVSAWVRNGSARLCFYEYYEKGPVRMPTICVCTSGPDAWSEVAGYYVPGGEGFKNASLVIAVAQGQSVDVDHVRIEELAPAAIPAGLEPITIENELIRMKLSPQATLEEFVCKETGVNYAAQGCPAPVFRAGAAWGAVPARFIRRRRDGVEIEFAEPNVTARIKIEACKRYFRFEVTDAQPADLQWLEIEFPLKKLKTQAWAFAGNYDDEFASCGFALNVQMRCSQRAIGSAVLGLRARCSARHGIKGAKMALLGSPRGQFTSVIQEVERDNGLPCPVLDGKWVRESEPVRRSYLFATGMNESDTDALIECAKVGHFQTILILKNAWLRTHGHFEINKRYFPDGRESFKRAVEKIHAAGLKAGVHVFGPSISPNDPYVTPVPDDRLLAVPCPPLAEAVDAKAKVLTLTGQPDLPPKRSRSRAFPGYYLRVGDEIVRYTDVDVGPPFRFTGCQRGACGTTASAHPADAPVRGLLAMWGFFMIDPDSTLLDEVAANFADVVNDCGLDMVYFDASDGSRNDYLDVGYYLDKCHLAYYSKFDHSVLYQTSMGTGSNLCWHIIPRSASADGHGDIKAYLDERLHSILRMRSNFVFADVGWYGLDLGSRPDRLEYVCGKCLGADGSISVQANLRILDKHPHAREIMEMVGRYERCRLADYFPEPVKAKLRAKGQEFKLFDDGKGGWTLWHAAYEPDRVITRLDGKQNVWTVQNDRKEPCRVAVEIARGARYSAGPDYDSPEAVVLEDFDDLSPYQMSKRNQYEKFVVGGGKVLTDQGPARQGVTQQLTASTEDARVGKACGVYTANNVGVHGGWTGRGKRFEKPIDLSKRRAIAFWVHGDGKSEIVYLQLRDVAGRAYDCRVQVSFKGWQLRTFPIPERKSMDWTKVDYMIFYYNNIPAKTTVTCKIDGVKALPGLAKMPVLSGMQLSVNGRPISFPGKMAAGEALTTDGLGTCTVWPGGMEPGRRVNVPQNAVKLKPGRNELGFSCNVAPGFQPDVNIRLIRLWPVEE